MRRGRPDKLTPEVQAKIVAAIVAGNFRDVAARCAGIGVRTLRTWLARGKAGDKKYRDFRHALMEAEGAAEINALALVRGAAEKDWRAAAWFLERKFPRRWGRRNRVEHRTPRIEPIEIREIVVRTREEASALLARESELSRLPERNGQH